jgi:CRISPR/Cas system-associated endoribonuclease Cas2
VTSNGQSVRVFTVLLFVGRGRTELTLSIVAPDVARVQVSAFEGRLARLLAARIPT